LWRTIAIVALPSTICSGTALKCVQVNASATVPVCAAYYRFDIRTAAGPSNVVQCALSGGPYTVTSHVRHVQVVWPSP
jgi:hypothetical protein